MIVTATRGHMRSDGLRHTMARLLRRGPVLPLLCLCCLAGCRGKDGFAQRPLEVLLVEGAPSDTLKLTFVEDSSAFDPTARLKPPPTLQGGGDKECRLSALIPGITIIDVEKRDHPAVTQGSSFFFGDYKDIGFKPAAGEPRSPDGLATLQLECERRGVLPRRSYSVPLVFPAGLTPVGTGLTNPNKPIPSLEPKPSRLEQVADELWEFVSRLFMLVGLVSLVSLLVKAVREGRWWKGGKKGTASSKPPPLPGEEELPSQPTRMESFQTLAAGWWQSRPPWPQVPPPTVLEDSVARAIMRGIRDAQREDPPAALSAALAAVAQLPGQIETLAQSVSSLAAADGESDNALREISRQLSGIEQAVRKSRPDPDGNAREPAGGQLPPASEFVLVEPHEMLTGESAGAPPDRSGEAAAVETAEVRATVAGPGGIVPPVSSALHQLASALHQLASPLDAEMLERAKEEVRRQSFQLITLRDFVDRVASAAKADPLSARITDGATGRDLASAQAAFQTRFREIESRVGELQDTLNAGRIPVSIELGSNDPEQLVAELWRAREVDARAAEIQRHLEAFIQLELKILVGFINHGRAEKSPELDDAITKMVDRFELAPMDPRPQEYFRSDEHDALDGDGVGLRIKKIVCPGYWYKKAVLMKALVRVADDLPAAAWHG